MATVTTDRTARVLGILDDQTVARMANGEPLGMSRDLLAVRADMPRAEAARIADRLAEAGRIARYRGAGGRVFYTRLADCATIGHGRRAATHRISYYYRGEDERTVELVCAPCAESYGRRPVLQGFAAEDL